MTTTEQSNDNHGRNILRPFVTLPIFFFFSPQMKRSVVISNKHGIYELPHELLKDLRFRKNQENFKTSWNYKLVNSPPPKLKLLSIQRKLLKNRN